MRTPQCTIVGNLNKPVDAIALKVGRLGFSVFPISLHFMSTYWIMLIIAV